MHLTSEKIQKELKQVSLDLLAYQPKKVILFGSLARGDYHEASDIDLVIIKETDKRFLERISDVLRYMNSSLPIEALVYTPSEWQQMIQTENSFAQTVQNEGVVLYEQHE